MTVFNKKKTRLVDHIFIIDCVAVAKQGNNALDSIHPTFSGWTTSFEQRGLLPVRGLCLCVYNWRAYADNFAEAANLVLRTMVTLSSKSAHSKFFTNLLKKYTNPARGILTFASKSWRPLLLWQCIGLNEKKKKNMVKPYKALLREGPNYNRSTNVLHIKHYYFTHSVLISARGTGNFRRSFRADH